MTTSDNVLLSEPKDGVRPLTLNGAAELNAISANLVHALTDALDPVLRDDDIPVVILARGRAGLLAGRRHLDAPHLMAARRPNLTGDGDAPIALTRLLGRIDKPIIAVVHGYALGAGLAFRSNLVVAAASPTFGPLA